MEKIIKALRSLLLIGGLLGVITGAAIGFYSVFGLWPKFDRLSGDMSSLMHLTPKLLLATEGSLGSSAALLDSGGATAQKTTHGVTGVVAPNDALHKNAAIMKTTATRLRSLAHTLAQMRQAAAGLNGDVSFALPVALLGVFIGAQSFMFGLFSLALGLILERTARVKGRNDQRKTDVHELHRKNAA